MVKELATNWQQSHMIQDEPLPLNPSWKKSLFVCFVDGEIFAMTCESLGHSSIIANIIISGAFRP